MFIPPNILTSSAGNPTVITTAAPHGFAAAVSGDGSTIGFASAATNITAGDTNGQDDVFVGTFKAPQIASQPVDQPPVSVGGIGATFTVTVVRALIDPDYQWQVSINGGSTWAAVATVFPTAIPHGDRNPSLIVFAAPGIYGAKFRVLLSNPSGSVASNPVTFSVIPTITLDRAALQFGATRSGVAFIQQTPNQTVRLSQSNPGTVTWTASSNQPWVTVSPASGTGAALLTVGTQFVAGLPATSTGQVQVFLTGASNIVVRVELRLNVLDSTAATGAVGSVDTPLEGTMGVTGSLAVTGWALDDLEVTQVQIWRDPHPADPPGAVVGGSPPQAGKVFVGYASFVEGARPDVQTANPSLPLNSRAGWGYLMLTRGLVWDGTGPFKLYAIAADREGHLTQIGAKTITIDNSTATKPFGAIDTPGQGATASGMYPNTGWVLAANPTATIPAGGVQVAIDGVFVPGVPSVSNRTDITGGFPGFPTAGAGRGLFIDTTQHTNGPHTIGWLVTDSTGQADGVGSRFFSVTNSSLAAAETSTATLRDLDELTPETQNVTGRRGFQPNSLFMDLGVLEGRRVLQGEELDRLDLRFDADASSRFTGYLRVDGRLTGLPIGSHLANQSFTWQLGAGFLGSYDLVFVRQKNGMPVARQDVRVTIHPQGSFTRPQIVIDTPTSAQQVADGFTLAGWAIDPTAPSGSGISSVHVWAYPLTGARPVFLGNATLGGVRTDVAALYGAACQACGFGLNLPPLPSGAYDLAVFAWSDSRGRFLPARVVRVIVR